MQARSCRRFNLRDVMILIAAIALAFTFALDAISGFGEIVPALRGTRDVISDWTVGMLPSVAVLTSALFILRLMPPRPPLRDLAAQPGAVACGAAVFVMAAGAMSRLSIWGVTGFLVTDWTSFSHPSSVLFTAIKPVEIIISHAVALAWLVLALGRGWRTEASWIDQTGRFLGVFWITLIPVYPWIGSWF